MSCDFYGPEVAVTTFQLSLAAGGRQLGRNQLPPIPILVKGSERRFAIEDCETIRLCTPSYYREDAQSLIWDMQEGVIASNPRVKERWDDPADLEELRRDDAETAGRRPLVRAAGMIAVKTLKVRELEESTLFYGDNCLIWCSSMKPRNSKQWSLWRASLESSYDHVSTVRDPQIFARALGAMAFQQQGLLGNSIAFRNPQTGYVAQCLSLPVVYGPVVYVDDRRAYIEESSSDLEFVARSSFSKTSEHRHQREYRFAILSNRGLEDNTLDLTVSTEMRWSLTERQKSAMPEGESQSPKIRTCLPSPRILACLGESPSTQPSADRSWSVFESQVRSIFHLAGVHHRETTKSRTAVHTVEDVNYERIEKAIAEEPTSPSDARIVKCIFDAGPGSVFTLYDLSGLNGKYGLSRRSGKAVVTASSPKPGSGDREVLINCSEFDGSSFLSSETDHLRLSHTPANPATTVRTNISDSADKVITITATSEDGTANSSFEIIFDSSLGIDVARTEQAPTK